MSGFTVRGTEPGVLPIGIPTATKNAASAREALEVVSEFTKRSLRDIKIVRHGVGEVSVAELSGLAKAEADDDPNDMKRGWGWWLMQKLGRRP